MVMKMYRKIGPWHLSRVAPSRWCVPCTCSNLGYSRLHKSNLTFFPLVIFFWGGGPGGGEKWTTVCLCGRKGSHLVGCLLIWQPSNQQGALTQNLPNTVWPLGLMAQDLLSWLPPQPILRSFDLYNKAQFWCHFISHLCLHHRHLESGKAKLWAWHFGS
jgi:hypothetical protein